MNAAYTYYATIDLRQANRAFIWDTIANVGDKGAHQFALKFIGQDGDLVDLTGADVKLYCIRSDDATVVCGGTVEGDYAVASTLQNCYYKKGPVQCTMVVTLNGVILSGARITMMVGESSTDTIIDPESEIPSIEVLAEEILALESQLATKAAIPKVVLFNNGNAITSSGTYTASVSGTDAYWRPIEIILSDESAVLSNWSWTVSGGSATLVIPEGGIKSSGTTVTFILSNSNRT